MADVGAANATGDGRLLPIRPARNKLETWVLKLETRGVRLRKITIIGVGLLGGSIGLAVKRRKLVSPGGVAGFVRRTASLKDCEKAGAVDFATTDLLAAVWDADLVILCTPLAQMLPRVKEM